jgi:Protein of unknown function (DUF1203)
MTHAFRLSPLPLEPFAGLFAMDEDALAKRNVLRMVATESPGFPCRVSLQDAAAGESVLLLPHTHHDMATPYRASGPIFVRENAQPARPETGEVPAMLRSRVLSLRAYDASGMMVSAEVTEGRNLETPLARRLADPRIAYLHLHFAGPGCYGCRVDRA